MQRYEHGGDIVNANRLMYAASASMLVIALLFRAALLGVMFHAAI